MKNIKRLLLLVGIFAFSITSCDVDGYDDYGMETTPSVAMNGEWWIDIIDEASGSVLAQHILHKTYDTNAGDGRMYIDDNQNGYWIKGTVAVDLNGLTFTTTDEDNLVDPGSTFNVTDGKVLKNAAHSESGVVTDSIYFKGEFSYDPGTIIIFAGHKRTGFLEDEY
ncbi:lipid-binding protein [Flavobacterium sp. C4GT6]|uniref:lipid-binding protein n=1 Tax=Flavobacterium sp. C4GT6 TaxID=3103818 RepID=UPI002ED68D2D